MSDLAKQKVKRALFLIEEAQGLLSQACGELCSVKWASPQWKLVGDHYDKTKALWYKVRDGIPWEKIKLDTEVPDESKNSGEA